MSTTRGDRMKITIVCNDNTCGIPGRITQWINRNTEHDCILVYGSDPFNHGIGGLNMLLSNQIQNRILDRLIKSDIIIFNDPAVPGISYHLYNSIGEEVHVDFSPIIRKQKLFRISNGTYYRGNHEDIFRKQISKR